MEEMEGEVVAGEQIFLELELGRQEEVLAKEKFVQEDGEDHQGPECEEPWQEEGGQEQELVSGQHFALQGEGLTLAVQVVAARGMLWEGEEILWELEVQSEVDVVAGQDLMEKKEHEVQQGPYREQQWEKEEMEGEVAAGEQIFLKLELGREEEVLAEEGFVQEEDGEDQQGSECEEPWQEEGGQEAELESGQHFVLERQGLGLAVQVVAARGMLWEGEEVFPDLELGRQEDVVHGELLQVEKEDEMVLGAESKKQWEVEGGQEREPESGQHFVLEQQGLMQTVQVVAVGGMLWEGEEVFPDLELGRQEEVVHGELLQVEKEDEVMLGPENEEQGEEEEACQEKLSAGEQIVLDGEDIVKVVEMRGEGQPETEAEAKQQEEKCEERERAESGQGGKCTLSPLEVLQALQSEMEPVNEQASRAFCRLKRRTWQRHRPYLELRSTHIEHIPGFWAKAFVSHPELSALISEQDEKMLSHMINVKVEEVRHASDRCKILLFFHNNPYFCNNVIVKEYLMTISGYRVSQCTPIQWYQHYEREVYRHWHQNSSLTFFNWFSDHNVAGSSRIAEIIIKDLWRNPLKYYVRTAPGEGRECRTGKN